MKITCGKFDNNLEFYFEKDLKYKDKIRIGSVNVNKLKNVKYEALSTNGKEIIYKKKVYKFDKFIDKFKNYKFTNFMVLTIKERNLLIDIFTQYNLRLKVFELLYPIFSDVKYYQNVRYSYNKLISSLNRIKKMGLKGKSLGDFYSNYYLFKIERKLRFKNGYDKYFFQSYKEPYREVFKLKEEKLDRVILALDFNSMFASCMLGTFIEPKTVQYKKFKNNLFDQSLIEELDNGLYRVVLKEPNSIFFNKFHPFKFSKLFSSFYFNLKDDSEIEILLFKNELSFYSKFFNSIKILECLYSKKSIQHPLRGCILETYNTRKKNKKEKKILDESLNKFELATMHSSTNQIKYKELEFSSSDQIKEYLLHNYNINLYYIDKIVNYKIKKNKFFRIEKIDEDKFLCKFIDLDAKSNLFSISSQILANSRLKMLQTLERLYDFPSAEICYCNVDSIHLSIDKSKLKLFFEKHKNLISDEIGFLKIETIAEKGYWFDIGRYWLFDNNEVILYKNVMFKNKHSKRKFISWNEIKIPIKNNRLRYVKNFYPMLYSNFSYSKRLNENYNFTRYNYEEIMNLDVATKSINNEIISSKFTKTELFKRIATD